jgi:hypothetical protein
MTITSSNLAKKRKCNAKQLLIKPSGIVKINFIAGANE